jgi:hypothetical protein
LLTEAIQEALDGQPADTLVGPIEVGTTWWVVRVERVQEDGTYTETHRDQLADVDLIDLIEETRATLDITQSLSNGAIEWAYRNIDATAPS